MQLLLHLSINKCTNCCSSQLFWGCGAAVEEQAACRFTTDESVITKWQNTDIKLTCRIYCGYRKKPARPETHSLLSLQERCVNKMACARCYNELHYILLLLSSFSLCVYLKSIVLTRLHTHTHRTQYWKEKHWGCNWLHNCIFKCFVYCACQLKGQHPLI